ncbi:hypothetical protein GCM10028783_15710 [Modestobacter muralis]
MGETDRRTGPYWAQVDRDTLSPSRDGVLSPSRLVRRTARPQETGDKYTPVSHLEPRVTNGASRNGSRGDGGASGSAAVLVAERDELLRQV